MSSTFQIDSRFCGPPNSGNGGYVCGRLAAVLGGDSMVRLLKPPPLETDLEIVHEGSRARLLDAGEPVAEAWQAPLALDPPLLPSRPEVERATQVFRGFEEHVFPGCFVCGPERGEADGLRIFPGPLDGTAAVAAPWVPDASLDDGSGRVAPEFVWAALDCPGAFAFPQPEGKVVVLGEFGVALRDPVAVEQPTFLLGWEIAASGRKHETGTALFSEDGRCHGLARGIWLEIDPPPATR